MRAITQADGVEPQATAEKPQPGFAIYYDVDNYTMVKDGDVTYIRPYQKPMTREEVLEAYGDYLSQLPEEERERQIDALMNPQPDTSLPPCEIEIVHLDMPYEGAVPLLRNAQSWKRGGKFRNTRKPTEITFSMYSGSEWNSPLEVRDYISDEQSGCFRIIRRFFMEAAEGHGVRFAAVW